jgi:hypothetical protein
METHSYSSKAEFKASVDMSGNVVLKKKSKIQQGRKSKAQGASFELKVRKDLEGKGWTVDKWSNNVDLEGGRLVACKRVFRPVGNGRSVMSIGTGFPDFICFDRRDDLFEVIGIEVKMNGLLSREEKKKCAWLLEHGVFGQILIASKIKEKNRIKIEYLDFLEVKKRMRIN